jgi:hypothetical protein
VRSSYQAKYIRLIGKTRRKLLRFASHSLALFAGHEGFRISKNDNMPILGQAGNVADIIFILQVITSITSLTVFRYSTWLINFNGRSRSLRNTPVFRVRFSINDVTMDSACPSQEHAIT